MSDKNYHSLVLLTIEAYYIMKRDSNFQEDKNINDFKPIISTTSSQWENFQKSTSYQNQHKKEQKYSKSFVSIFKIELIIKNFLTGLPRWYSGKQSACQCRGHGFDLQPGKISHAIQQLSSYATTAEPCALEPLQATIHLESLLCNEKSHRNLKPMRCN